MKRREKLLRVIIIVKKRDFRANYLENSNLVANFAKFLSV